MVIRPFLRYAALYALVEMAAVVLLVWAFGVGWALLILAGVFLAGVVLAGSQLKAQLVALRRSRVAPRTAAADGALVSLGAVLVLLPGVVSTAAGVLMLAPPTRGAMRPLAAGLITRGVSRRMAAMDAVMFSAAPYAAQYPGAGRGDYIDGEVIDGEVIDGEVDHRALP